MQWNNQILETSFEHPIIVFDGMCILCDRSVQWILSQDKNKMFVFMTLQNLKADHANSVLLIHQGITFTKSEAVLRVLHLLGGWYPTAAKVGRLIPLFLRDRLYDLIAKNRYRYFGRHDHCIIPDQDSNKQQLQ